jgi:hypothetical protein
MKSWRTANSASLSTALLTADCTRPICLPTTVPASPNSLTAQKQTKLHGRPFYRGLSRIYEAGFVIRKQEGRGLLTGPVQFQRTGLRKDNHIRALNVATVMGVQSAVTQDNLSIRQKTGVKREDHDINFKTYQLWGSFFKSSPCEQIIEHRKDIHGKNTRNQNSSNGRGTAGMPHLSPYSPSDRQGKHSQDSG